MITYVVFVIFVSSIFFLFKIKKNKLLILLTYLIAAFLSGFRYNVGVDYKSYVLAYNNILDGWNSGYFEIGDVWLIQFVDFLGGTPQLFFLIMALITNILVYLFIIKFSKNYIISSLFYFFITIFYTASFNGMRQALAISIFLYAITYIRDRNLSKYIILVLFASLFHFSALLMLPLYFISIKRFSLLQYIIIGIVSLLIISFSINFVITFLNYTAYLDFLNTTSSKITIYAFIIVSFYFIIMIKNITIDVLIFKNMLFISILIMILQIIFSNLSMILIRFNSYFLFALLPMVSYVPIYNKIKINRLFYVLFIVLFTYSYFANTILFKGEMYKLVPFEYNFQLFKEK